MTPTQPNAKFPSRGMGLHGLVALTLALFYAFARARWLDLHDYDDMARTVLAKGWALRPFFFTGDGYWLTLPFILRGSMISVFDWLGFGGAEAGLFAAHLVSLIILWWVWFVLCACLTELRGGVTAVTLFTIAYLCNIGTFRLASYAASETDYLLWISVAVWTVLRSEREGRFPNRRLLLFGAALSLACMVRYEAWVLAVVLIVSVAARFRPWRGSLLGALALILPAAPVFVWIGYSSTTFGDPLHFIKHQESYLGVYESSHSLRAMTKALLKLNPFVVPLVVALGAIELARRRTDPAIRWFTPVCACFFLLSVYASWNILPDMRYFWPVLTVFCLPAALGFESLPPRTPKRSRRILAGVIILVTLCAFFLMLVREKPFASIELRRFAQQINRSIPHGTILIRDYSGAERRRDLAIFRIHIDHDRLIPCEWIDGCQIIPQHRINELELRAVLARDPPSDVPPGAAPLLVSEGWGIWTIPNGA